MAENPRGGDRMAQPGEWYVEDYDGNPLPGAWPTEYLAVKEGLAGRYLLTGGEVRLMPAAGTEAGT